MRLGLPVFHITEPEIRRQIPAAVYEAQVGLVETALDGPGIAETLARLRESQGAR